MTKLNDPMGQAFIKFFRSQGFKFVDADTGKEIKPDEDTDESEGEENGASALGAVSGDGDNDNSRS